jgi:vacuolar-type H+-ATPase subunit I/STV1
MTKEEKKDNQVSVEKNHIINKFDYEIPENSYVDKKWLVDKFEEHKAEVLFFPIKTKISFSILSTKEEYDIHLLNQIELQEDSLNKQLEELNKQLEELNKIKLNLKKYI